MPNRTHLVLLITDYLRCIEFPSIPTRFRMSRIVNKQTITNNRFWEPKIDFLLNKRNIYQSLISSYNTQQKNKEDSACESFQIAAAYQFLALRWCPSVYTNLLIMNQPQPMLPEGFCVLETQVAGHIFSKNTVGMLKDDERCVLKPLGKPECGARELSFYESLQQNDPVLVAASKFVPKFYKKIRLEVNSRDHTFLQLEDLTHGMLRPCIMDIKVGKRTWDPLASPRKRKVEEQKYSLCKQVLGLCLPGFQVYSDSGYKKYDKEFGKQLDSEGLRESIIIFLNAQRNVCKPLVRELLRQLYDIREWFREQRHLHFYASSLLIIYDYVAFQTLQNAQQMCMMSQINRSSNGNLSTRICDDLESFTASTTCLETCVKVKMIDFAHVFPANNGSIDLNYMFGLQSLIGILEEMLQR